MPLMKCDKCSREYELKEKNCPYCGAKQKLMDWPFRLGALVLLVAAVGLGSFLYSAFDYGSKFPGDGIDIYYTSQLNQPEVEKLAHYFTEGLKKQALVADTTDALEEKIKILKDDPRHAFNLLAEPAKEPKIQVQLTRTPDTYQVKLCPDIILVSPVHVDKFMAEHPALFQALSFLGGEISRQVFGGNKVEIHFCNKNFKTLKIIPPSPLPMLAELEQTALRFINESDWCRWYHTAFTSVKLEKESNRQYIGTAEFVSGDKVPIKVQPIRAERFVQADRTALFKITEKLSPPPEKQQH